jgi:hypothetical protein
MLKSLAVGAVGLLVLAVFPLLAADDKPAGAPGTDEQAAAAKQRAGGAAANADPSAASDWAMNATIIEACSCPMFCQCYFSTEPAGHAAGHEGHAAHGDGGEHYCKFNNAYKVNHGHFGNVSLDGAKYWFNGDLGDDFSKGEMNWGVLTFDPSVKPEQRAGIITAMRQAYPVKWKSFTVAKDATVEWKADKDHAVAKLDGGKAAELSLKRFPGNDGGEPVVIHNLKYWGTPRNDGFVLMPNEIEATRKVPQGQKPYEFKGTNGFMITFDITSKDAAPAAAAKGMSGKKS